MAATKMFNKQQWTAEKERFSPAMGMDGEQNLRGYENLRKASNMTGSCKQGKKGEI
jgi:hypothetical protein